MATRESVVYRGERFWLQTSGAYFQSGRKAAPERLLHRRVWSDTHGPIPDGEEVHHLDLDWRNNDPANLELRPPGSHQRDHMRQRLHNPVERTRLYEYLWKARLAAAAWHSSPTGIAWHRAHGRNTWVGRKTRDAACERCGLPFGAFFVGTRFCSRACAQAVAWSSGRYKTSERVCLHCGATFLANRHRTTACCSRLCSNRHRAGHPRLQPDAHGA